MNKAVLFSSCASVIAAGLLASPMAAMAQTAAPAATDANSSQVEQVIVTADRRAENLQNVPITAEVTTASQLAEREIISTQALSDFVPGFNITRANAGSVPFLRGIGNFTATVGNEAAVATYIDDVYRPAAGASNYAFNDVARVEVLNGPQGTLFGRNAAGGVVNVSTRDPSLQGSRLDVELGLANYDTGTVSLYGSTVLNDKLAADLSIYYEDQTQGWGKNLFDGTQAYTSQALSFHTKWIYVPTADDKFTFVAYHDREYNQEGAASNVIPGTINAAGYGHIGGFYDVDTNLDGFDDTKAYGASVKYEHNFGKFNLTSISSGQEADWDSMIENDSSPANFQEAHVNAKETTYQEELRLASDASQKIQWIGGLYWFRDRSNPDPFTQYGTGLNKPQNIQFTNSVQDTTSYAVFGQVTIPIYDTTHLVLGARESDDMRHITGATNSYPTATATAPTVITNAGSFGTSVSAPTFRVSLDHDFTSDLMAYVSWNRGFKSGNYNTNTATQPPTLPETLDAFEVGTKAQFLDRRLQVNVAAFYYLMHNLQVQQQLSTGTYQTNAGAGRYEGVDFSIVARPTENFTVTWASEYLDAIYTSYANAQFNIAKATGGYTSFIANAAGYEIPFADKFTSSVTGRYVIPTNAGPFALSVVGGYHDGFHFDTQGLVSQPSYLVMNASLTWTPSAKWDLSLWGDNVTDARYYAQKQVSATGETYSAAAPATFGVKLKYHLN